MNDHPINMVAVLQEQNRQLRARLAELESGLRMARDFLSYKLGPMAKASRRKNPIEDDALYQFLEDFEPMPAEPRRRPWPLRLVAHLRSRAAPGRPGRLG